jgi:acid phosphatase
MVLPLAVAAAIAVAACGSSTSSVSPMASGAPGTPAANTLSPGAAATQGSNPAIGQTPNPTPTANTLSPGAAATQGSNPTIGQTPNPTPTAKPTPKPTPKPTTKPNPTPSPKPKPTAPPVGGLPDFSHVYVIIFENKEYSSIVGSSSAPYINSLISKYGLATNFYAETHPSEPNYIALTSGGTQGVTDDGVYNLSVNNLFDQVVASGRTWHAYQQGYPGNCFTGTSSSAVVDGVGSSGAYARRHDPAISYTSISGNAAKCANISDLASFNPAAASFEFITPNMINDMHDGTIADGDNFLKAFLPQITGSSAFANSVVFVTFDEGTTNVNGGGHIATLAITPHMTPGFQATAAYTHYSILRTIEQAWALPYLGSAASASWMQFPY